MAQLRGIAAVGGLATVAVGAYTVLPNVAPYYARRYYQRYQPPDSCEVAVEVDDHVLSLFDNVLQNLNFPAEKQKKVDLFISHDLNPQWHGSLSIKQHSLLGVPWTFNWRSDADLQAHKDDLLSKTFPWAHPRAGSVRAALMLTDDEKEFVLARQLGYLDTRNIYARLFQRLGCLSLGFLLGHWTILRLGLYDARVHTRRLAIQRGTIFSLCSLVGLALMVYMEDVYTCYLDRHADDYAGSVSERYARAGVSYYDKILESNRALRDIVPGAEEKFTVYGNEVAGLFRTKTLPLVARRDRLRQLAEGFEAKSSESS